MSAKAEVRRRLEATGADPRKSLGQNFLVDDAALESIADAVGPGPTLEIGPGPGLLSDRLASNGPLRVIEKDRRWAEFLRAHFLDRVEVVEADALRVPWTSPGPGPAQLCGNLPYYVSGPLLVRALKHASIFERAVFMVQDEVAARIIASPGSKIYGRLSVMSALVGDARRIRRVSPGAFWPAPKVTSALVEISFRVPRSRASFEQVERVVKTAFSQRRKRLSNALSPYGPDALARARERGYDLSMRAEEWAPEVFFGLAELLREE